QGAQRFDCSPLGKRLVTSSVSKGASGTCSCARGARIRLKKASLEDLPRGEDYRVRRWWHLPSSGRLRLHDLPAHPLQVDATVQLLCGVRVVPTTDEADCVH